MSAEQSSSVDHVDSLLTVAVAVGPTWWPKK